MRLCPVFYSVGKRKKACENGCLFWDKNSAFGVKTLPYGKKQTRIYIIGFANIQHLQNEQQNL